MIITQIFLVLFAFSLTPLTVLAIFLFVNLLADEEPTR